MLIKTLPTTLFQLFKKIILILKITIKSTIDADDNFWMKYYSVTSTQAGQADDQALLNSSLFWAPTQLAHLELRLHFLLHYQRLQWTAFGLAERKRDFLTLKWV